MDVALFLGMAQNAVDGGNIQAAFELYEAALQKSPNNIEVLEAYGEMMLHHGDSEAAKRMLLHAVSISPNEGYVKYLNLAQMSSGQDALRYYESAVAVLLSELARTRKKKVRSEVQRTIASAKCAIAELFLTDLCDEVDAEASCEREVLDAEMYCKQNAEVYQLLGSLRLSQQRCDEALTALRHAVRLVHTLSEQHQPTYESKLELGKLLMQADAKDAFNFFLEILSLDDSDPYVWFLLGESARLRGKYNDSARLLRHARIRVEAAQAGPEALAEVDQSIQLLVQAMGGPEAVGTIPYMDEPNPLDYLEVDEDDDDEEVEEEGELDEEEAEWEDCDDDDE